ncbi:hypothetical protein KQI89_17145 [Clostridium sp. MSJ-4]|uniref:Uncharacterized protein n=1 Tax=Clostridium simiarum TaxID=2841506 RepID=A0ABS6F774_9CLOT|nr:MULTISPECIES: hypothetical protein [Clostridium]MBU5593468.1 hypothetical protein [Clostridium simiarum]
MKDKKRVKRKSYQEEYSNEIITKLNNQDEEMERIYKDIANISRKKPNNNEFVK